MKIAEANLRMCRNGNFSADKKLQRHQTKLSVRLLSLSVVIGIWFGFVRRDWRHCGPPGKTHFETSY